MARGAVRTGRIIALVLAVAPAALAVLPLPSPASTSAAPTQDCSTTTLLERCPTTTRPLLTTTTTTEKASTTSTAQATATTARQTTTTPEASAQETITTLDAVTGADLLIPGDGTEGAESTTTTLLAARIASDGGLGDGTLIALVIVGLAAIAGVVALLTWRYWVATRPPLRDADTASARAG